LVAPPWSADEFAFEALHQRLNENFSTVYERHMTLNLNHLVRFWAVPRVICVLGGQNRID